MAPAGKAGAFLGPDDSLFAILPEAGQRISIYSTTAFKGHGPPAYTIDLGKPATQLGGLFAGPPALGAPYVGAEAAAEAKKKEEAAAKAEAEAAAKAAEEGGEGKEGEGVEEKEVDPFATSGNGAGLLPGGRLPRWMRAQDDDSSDDGGDFIPVVGIGPAFKGGNRGRPAGADAYSAAMARAVAGFITPAAAEADAAAAAGPTHHSGGGVLMWHAAGGKLVMAGLPAPGVTYVAGDDSDDPDAAEDLGGAAKHEGTVSGPGPPPSQVPSPPGGALAAPDAGMWAPHVPMTAHVCFGHPSCYMAGGAVVYSAHTPQHACLPVVATLADTQHGIGAECTPQQCCVVRCCFVHSLMDSTRQRSPGGGGVQPATAARRARAARGLAEFGHRASLGAPPLCWRHPHQSPVTPGDG